MTSKPAPGYKRDPDYRVDIEACPRRVRVQFGDTMIADSTNVLVILESKHVPVYYFPRSDVDQSTLEPSELTTFCPFKGEASYWSVAGDGNLGENAVWSYLDPFEEVLPLKGYMAFYWNKADHWYEEDEKIFVHPRDPHKRVDAVPSRRPVEIVLGGEKVARSEDAVFVFETGMPTRYYLPASDVRMALLTKSPSSTRCPYKGVAEYWSAEINGTRFDDIVWSYPDPIAECPKIKGLLCFYNENVDEILVDGAPIDRAETKWSNRYFKETVDGPEHIV